MRLLKLKKSSKMPKATVTETQDGLDYAIVTNDLKISETGGFFSDK